jgi:Electron transfer DM13
MNRKTLILTIIVVAIAIPVGVYTFSPLFINRTINEPLPSDAVQQYQKFISMDQQHRINAAKSMDEKQKNMIMRAAAAQINSTVNEQADNLIQNKQQQKIITSAFIGAGDGFHNTEGAAKVIPLQDRGSILRLENFRSTNGPNVHVYMSTNKDATDFVDLGRLKANIGNQNYNIPIGINVAKYKYVLIWCKDFSVLFGSAQLTTS